MPRQEPAAPVRSIWSGTITFGLVSIPVNLYAAVRARQKAMKLVDVEGRPLGRRYVTEDGKVLKNDEIVRGYETDSGKTVVITDEEFEAAAPEMSRDIQLDRFVPADSIPPGYFERPYYLAPDERAGKAYSLLAQTMERAGRVAIGEFVMRGNEHLVAIIAQGGVLRAQTLRYEDELRSAADVGLPKPARPAKARVGEYAKAIAALAEDKLDFDELEDREADALHDLAARKAKARQDVIDAAELEDDDADAGGGAEIVDLMKVLRESLGGKPSKAAVGAGAGATVTDLATRRTAEPKPAAKKTAARKTAPKKTAAKAAAKKPPRKAAAKRA